MSLVTVMQPTAVQAAAKHLAKTGQSAASQSDLLDPTIAAAEALQGANIEDPFARWDLSPNVRQLLVQIAQSNARAEIRDLMHSLQNQGVSKDLVQDVMTAKKSFFNKAWSLINNSDMKEAMGKAGQLTKNFTLDGKGLGWDNGTKSASVDWSDGVKGTYADSERDLSVEAGYSEKNKDGQAKFVMGDGTKSAKHTAFAKGSAKGGEASYERALGDETHRGEASFKAKDDGYEGKASYKHKDGKNSEKYSASAKHKTGKGGVVTLGTDHASGKDGKDTTRSKLELLYGKEAGARAELDMKRKGFELKSQLGGTHLKDDNGTTTSIGGSANLNLFGADAKSKDDDVNLALKGDYTGKTKDGSRLDRFAGSADASFGKSKFTLGGASETSHKGGSTTSTHDWNLKLAHGFDLNKQQGRRLDMRASGNMALNNNPGETDAWQAGIGATYTSGKSKGAFSFSGDLKGGRASGKDLAKNIGLPKGVPVQGSGHFLDLDTTTKWGGNTLKGGLAMGQANGVGMGSFNLNYDHKNAKGKSDFLANLNGAGVMGGNKSGGMLGGDFTWKPNDAWSVGAGAQYKQFGQGEGQWNANANVGYQWSKNNSLKLQSGVAGGPGQGTRFIPELNYKSGKNIGASVMGAFGQQTTETVGGKINLPAGVSVFGGYGDMTALDSPYQGNSGLSLDPNIAADALGLSGQGPGGQSAFFGVTWDVLEAARQWSGKK